MAELKQTNQSELPPIVEPEQLLDGDEGFFQMHVSPIPPSWDERNLREFFEDYGPISEVRVVYNKRTKERKDHCFITFFNQESAFAAYNALHNVKTLPGMTQPVQIRVADLQKIFIGMLPKRYDEQMIRNMFSPFGRILDIHIFRDINNHSKGCAKVTFSSYDSAWYAVKTMHRSQLMEGCTAPLVVKFTGYRKQRTNYRSIFNVLTSVNTNTHVENISGLLRCADSAHSSQTPSTLLNSEQQCEIRHTESLRPQLGSPLLKSNSLTTPICLANHTLNPSGEECILPTYVNLGNSAFEPNVTNNPELSFFQNPVTSEAVAFTHNEASTLGLTASYSNINLVPDQLNSLYVPNIPTTTISPFLNYTPTTVIGSANSTFEPNVTNDPELRFFPNPETSEAVAFTHNEASTLGLTESYSNINYMPDQLNSLCVPNIPPTTISPFLNYTPTTVIGSANSTFEPNVINNPELSFFQNPVTSEAVAFTHNEASTSGLTASYPNINMMPHQLNSLYVPNIPTTTTTISPFLNYTPTTVIGSANSTFEPNVTNDPELRFFPNPETSEAVAFTHNAASTSGLTESYSNINSVPDQLNSLYVPNIPPTTISPFLNYALPTVIDSANFNLSRPVSQQQLTYYYNFLEQGSIFAEEQIKGPEGANLYVSCFPPSYTDTDLAQIFMPFGNVISAKVFLDRVTKLSKKFGFVSYDNPIAAVKAIQTMNGARIDGRKLKVKLKKRL